MTKRIVVWLTIDPDKEGEFNEWYEGEYIPRFTTQIPGIQAVTRWRIPETSTYLTVYDLNSELTVDELNTALRNPDRKTDKEAWLQWETTYITDFRDGFFENVFEYRPASEE